MMKITQIIPVQNGDYTNVWGLGDDNSVYTYSYKTGNWRQFKATEKK